MLEAEVPSGQSMSSMLKCTRLVPKCLRANVRKWPKSCCVLCTWCVRLVPKCNMLEVKVPNGQSMSFVLKCARLPTRQSAIEAKEFVVSCVPKSELVPKCQKRKCNMLDAKWPKYVFCLVPDWCQRAKVQKWPMCLLCLVSQSVQDWCQSARSRSAICQKPKCQMAKVILLSCTRLVQKRSKSLLCRVSQNLFCKIGAKVPEAEVQYARSQSAKWPNYFFCLVPDRRKSGQRVCCVVYPKICKIGAKVPEAEGQYARSQSAKWPKYVFCLVPDWGQRAKVQKWPMGLLCLVSQGVSDWCQKPECKSGQSAESVTFYFCYRVSVGVTGEFAPQLGPLCSVCAGGEFVPLTRGVLRP